MTSPSLAAAGAGVACILHELGEISSPWLRAALTGPGESGLAAALMRACELEGQAGAAARRSIIGALTILLPSSGSSGPVLNVLAALARAAATGKPSDLRAVAVKLAAHAKAREVMAEVDRAG